VQTFVEIGQSVRDIAIFYFSNVAAVRHLGCCACVWTTHEEHLVVFTIVQNLVGISAVVSMQFFYFASLA